MIVTPSVVLVAALIITAIAMLPVTSAFARYFIKAPKISTLMTRYMGKKASIRPTLDDVERISQGKSAKKRGTGSRAVPHRLNASERKEWEMAKKRKYLQLRGTGWRKERGDSPLANTYRNYCDATAIPCISIIKSLGGSVVGSSKLDSSNICKDGGAQSITDASESSSSGNSGGNNNIIDYVTVDFSPLRLLDVTSVASSCIESAQFFQSNSVVFIEDRTDYLKQGWLDVEPMLQQDAIWRIPPSTLTVGFTVRSDSKKFAEMIVSRVISNARGNRADVDTRVDDLAAAAAVASQ